MITDCEADFTSVLPIILVISAKTILETFLVGNHAAIFTGYSFPNIFVRSVVFVWTMVLPKFMPISFFRRVSHFSGVSGYLPLK